MAFAGERKDADIAAALEERKGTDELNKVFPIIDQDTKGYIEEDEELLSQKFGSNANASLQAGDTDGDLKIRAEDLVRK